VNESEPFDPAREHERNQREGKTAPVLGALVFWLYGLSKRRGYRALLRNIILRYEGGELYSVTARRILSVHHDLHVGMYTGRGCFLPYNYSPGTRIGRYSALFRTARAFNANHPTTLKSTHAFFFNPSLGYAKEDLVTRTQLTIGSDVWIGHNAIISPSVSNIGHGAIIGAGVVVHQDVEPYAVVVGNPGRVVRYRFSEEIRKELLESRWWEKSFEELLPEFESFQQPLETDVIR
jgi:acetyltransferase-like isoleucine patch superfamily enzyme